MEAALKLSALTETNVFILIESSETRKFGGSPHLCQSFATSLLTPAGNDVQVSLRDFRPNLREIPLAHAPLPPPSPSQQQQQPPSHSGFSSPINNNHFHAPASSHHSQNGFVSSTPRGFPSSVASDTPSYRSATNSPSHTPTKGIHHRKRANTTSDPGESSSSSPTPAKSSRSSESSSSAATMKVEVQCDDVKPDVDATTTNNGEDEGLGVRGGGGGGTAAAATTKDSATRNEGFSGDARPPDRIN